MDEFLKQVFGAEMGEAAQTVKEARKPNKNGTIIALVVSIIIFIVLEYMVLLPINLRSPQFIMFLVFNLFIFFGLRSLLTLKFDTSPIAKSLPIMRLKYSSISKLLAAE